MSPNFPSDDKRAIQPLIVKPDQVILWWVWQNGISQNKIFLFEENDFQTQKSLISEFSHIYLIQKSCEKEKSFPD
jgi:hypothetical protein